MEDTKVALQQLGITNQKPNWKEIFGFDKDAKLTFNDVYKKYRKLMLQYHPDRTGNNDVTILLNDLYEKIKKIEQKQKEQKKQVTTLKRDSEKDSPIYDQPEEYTRKLIPGTFIRPQKQNRTAPRANIRPISKLDSPYQSRSI
jgi:hypothetical protein